MRYVVCVSLLSRWIDHRVIPFPPLAQGGISTIPRAGVTLPLRTHKAFRINGPRFSIRQFENRGWFNLCIVRKTERDTLDVVTAEPLRHKMLYLDSALCEQDKISVIAP